MINNIILLKYFLFLICSFAILNAGSAYTKSICLKDCSIIKITFRLISFICSARERSTSFHTAVFAIIDSFNILRIAIFMGDDVKIIPK